MIVLVAATEFRLASASSITCWSCSPNTRAGADQGANREKEPMQEERGHQSIRCLEDFHLSQGGGSIHLVVQSFKNSVQFGLQRPSQSCTV